MWVKTEDGKLYNLQNAQAVEAIETESGWIVTVRYAGTSVRATEDNPPLRDPYVALLTSPKANAEALYLVSELAHAMSNIQERDESELLDLNDIPSGYHHRAF